MADTREDEIRSRIEKRNEDRAMFLVNLVGFVIFNGIIWLTLLDLSNPTGTVWGYMGLGCTGIWLVGLVVHAVMLLIPELSQREVEAEVEREMQRLGYAQQNPGGLADLDAEDESSSPKRAHK